MSGPDEFDPMIERLFARSPALPDVADFAARVEQRLDNGSRVRTLALSLAGLVGGVIAVREAVGANLVFQAEAASDNTARLVSGGLDSAALQAQTSLQSGLDQLGLGVGLTSMAGMQMFWIVTAVLIATAALATLKVTDQI